MTYKIGLKALHQAFCGNSIRIKFDYGEDVYELYEDNLDYFDNDFFERLSHSDLVNLCKLLEVKNIAFHKTNYAVDLSEFIWKTKERGFEELRDLLFGPSSRSLYSDSDKSFITVSDLMKILERLPGDFKVEEVTEVVVEMVNKKIFIGTGEEKI